jgi:hypothetical protein
MVIQLMSSYAGVMVFEAGGLGAQPADGSEPAGQQRRLPAIDLILIRTIGRSGCVVRPLWPMRSAGWDPALKSAAAWTSVAENRFAFRQRT